MPRRYLYTEIEKDDFLPVLNQELDELHRRLDAVENERYLLAGPNPVDGRRRDCLLAKRVELPAGEPIVTVDIPYKQHALSGNPLFKKADHVSYPLFLYNGTVPDPVTVLEAIMTQLDEKRVVFQVHRDPGFMLNELDVTFHVRVSGVV
jgi:hypothetical protein